MGKGKLQILSYIKISCLLKIHTISSRKNGRLNKQKIVFLWIRKIDFIQVKMKIKGNMMFESHELYEEATKNMIKEPQLIQRLMRAIDIILDPSPESKFFLPNSLDELII